MIFIQKALFILSFSLIITPALAQTVDASLKINPLLELGINTKTLGLKGNVLEMQEHKFATDMQGHTKNDSASVSIQYKFDQNGFTKEIEETIKNKQSKKSFFSYTNKGYNSHIDIETTLVTTQNDSTETEKDPFFSTVDYKYVQKKNILYKGEDYVESMPKKKTTKKEYFYHFNDGEQIFQIVDQTSDLITQYNYDSNGLIKESLTSKSGVASYKNNYKYDRNDRLINITSIYSSNKVKSPNEETFITYKLDLKGNIIEKKIKSYKYSSKGDKIFTEGLLYLYNYTYL
jgi:hypothetical protein